MATLASTTRAPSCWSAQDLNPTNVDEPLSVEELFRQIQADELADSTSFGRAKPIPYARSRGIAPQRVYALIRNHRLQYTPCGCCGTMTVDVLEADIALRIRVPTETVQETTEVTGEDLATDTTG
jgi:hypothetical protein